MFCFVILCWSGVLVPNEDGLPLRHLHSLLVRELLHRLVIVVVDYRAAGEHLLRGGWAQRSTVGCCRPENTADRSSAHAHERQNRSPYWTSGLSSPSISFSCKSNRVRHGYSCQEFWTMCIWKSVCGKPISYHGIKKVIVTLYFTIQTFSHNFEEKKSELWEMNLQLWGKKVRNLQLWEKSWNCDIKFVVLFFILWWKKKQNCEMYTLKNKGASRCHRRTFLSKWFHKEPLTSEEHFCFTKDSLWRKIFRLLKGKKEVVL